MLEPNEKNMRIRAESNVGNGLGVKIVVEFPDGLGISDNPWGLNLNMSTAATLDFVNQLLTVTKYNIEVLGQR